jgi:peptidoglycan/LPS O-acetylase OafA/YrhL
MMLQTFLVKSIAYNPIIWSLAVESAFYVIAPLIWRRSLVIAALCAISIGFYVLPFEEHGLIYTVMLKANAVKYFWPFGFGVLLYRYNTTWTYATCLALGAATISISPINIGEYAIFTYAVTIASIWIARRWSKRSPALDYLGDVSYPLYLFQFPVFVTLYAVFATTNGLALFAGALVISIAAFELIDVRLKPLLFERIKRHGLRIPALGTSSSFTKTS